MKPFSLMALVGMAVGATGLVGEERPEFGFWWKDKMAGSCTVGGWNFWKSKSKMQTSKDRKTYVFTVVLREECLELNKN